MLVRLLARISGTRDGEAWPDAGAVVDLPSDEAQPLISSGMARRASTRARVTHVWKPKPPPQAWEFLDPW